LDTGRHARIGHQCRIRELRLYRWKTASDRSAGTVWLVTESRPDEAAQLPKLLCPECKGRGTRLAPIAAVITTDDGDPHMVTAGNPQPCNVCDGSGRLASGPPV
jgi:hypothetical protein